MTEVKVKSNLFKTVSLMEQVIGPRQYWIHNRVGGAGWEVTNISGGTSIKLNDAKMLTYLLLKLK